ncbi:PREDICTED: relA-associated inhibitor-like, partial [Aptenodytes forsteri]|uniref:relA-associated inhibitor-like n=1 Tax=Aptenodytes forsteri TaxID=9233 RepID=UPI000904767E
MVPKHRVPREVSLAPLTPWLPQERRSALRDPSSPRRRPGARVRLNPLVLLLDAALTGELDVVQQAVAEVGLSLLVNSSSLVRHGAAIFATTTSDGSLAVEKCDPYREGYTDCYNYLT